MIKHNIRPYEISLWTLQDGFITILKPFNLDVRGQIETPVVVLKDDGTQEISFSFPMYYYENGEYIENPIWYTLKNGTLVENLRKLKVIFNKGEKEERVFEYVITNITETHSNGTLICELKAEGLAFQELGKVGYKISLSQADFEEEYEEWWNGDKTTSAPIMSLNYWADKVFKNSDWTYSIQMDWSGFDGVLEEKSNEEREQAGLRRTDKIYEEEYVASWGNKDGELVPHEMISFQEKARAVEIDKSNRYNITQTLAETFGVYCKYEYKYDENYHIIGKECVFYNNYLNEREGGIDINYPFDGSKIEREKDSTDVITKMYIVPIDDDSSSSGLITIADVSANKSREDYILNFDYLYQIGTISQEQYDAIDDYERTMFNLNNKIEPVSFQIAKLQNDLVEYQAQKAIATEGQTQAKEQMAQAGELLNAITKGTNRLYKNLDNPYRGTLLAGEIKDGVQTYYIKLTTEGIFCPTSASDRTYGYPKKEGDLENIYGIHLWYKKDGDTPVDVEYTDNFSIEKDSNGNVYQLSNIKLMPDIYGGMKTYYVSFAYLPQLHYQNIYNTFSKQLLDDESLEKEADNKIAEIKEKLKKLQEEQDEIIIEKEKIIADFENMMGPALREGSWQADEYTDYGIKYDEKITTTDSSDSQFLSFLWDSEVFEEEQLNYYETFGDGGQAVEKNYYPAIALSPDNLNAIKDNLTNLSIVWDVSIPASVLTRKQAVIGSEAKIGFLRDNSSVLPILFITSTLSQEDIEKIKTTGRISVISSSVNNNFEIETQEQVLIPNNKLTWVDYENNLYSLVYPRIEIKSLLLKDSDETFGIKSNDIRLEKFYDYSLLIRDESYYATVSGVAMLKDATLNKTFEITYTLSNAALALYLDALEISKTNAFPQVSYSIDVSALNEKFIKTAYSQLNRIVNINDAELKFDNVRGYISELELNLDNPWEDKIIIQNYKTKFEDLFSSIVASTEQMKTNAYSYGIAAGAFNSSGSLKQDVIQNTINQVDLTYAFQGGNLTIDEINGIWATSDTGVVAMRGGGIFCATQKDSYGNWLWNTGIMPSGINANLLTAGQIDTNLVKIYSGDNLRFQLNGDGLFAYSSTETGDADFNKYVVHNNDGLFLTQVNGNNKNNLVEISWDGLIIRNDNGDKIFYADDNGNLSISGTIAAKDGEIGGWLVKEDGLYNTAGTAGIISKADEAAPYPMFWVNGGGESEFRVLSDGTVFTNNIIARGFISTGSFIGNTSTDEIDNKLREIEIAILEGTTFIFNNLNYDGVLSTEPASLYFKIKTNALTALELTESEYIFSCRKDELSEWVPIDANWIEWEPQYLTFKIKSDIMYQGENIPLASLEMKVEKQGKKRNVLDNGQVNYDEDYTYSATIQLNAERNGIGKFITEMEPQSYTFIEDKNAGIEYQATQTYSVVLTGFTQEEAAMGRWLIDGNDCGLDMTIIGETTSTFSSTNGDSAILTDEAAVLIGEEEVLDGDIIVGDDLSTNNDFEVFLEKIGENQFKAYAVVGYQKVQEGGSLKLTFKMNQAMRDGFCFRTRNGSDGVNIVLESSSGDSLTSGDTNTELATNVYFGSQLVNAENKYYYVWKKDNVALSQLKVRSISQIENEDTTLENIEIIETISTTDEEKFFTQRKIYVSAADFGVKAIYSCAVFTTLEEAKAEYALMNEEQKE